MPLLSGLFGPPDVTRLEAERDIRGLVKALGYGRDDLVRQHAAEALGRLGSPLSIEALIGALRAEEDVRQAAITALVRIGEQAVGPLIAHFCGDHACPPHVREAEATALVKIGQPAVKPLIALFQRGYGEAATLLGRIGDERAVAPLIAALKQRNPLTEKVAADALAMIGRPAVRALLGAEPLLAHPKLVHDALVQIGQPAVEILASYLMIEPRSGTLEANVFRRNVLRRIGPPAVELLAANLKAGDAETRKTAAVALGEIGEASAVEALVAAVGDEDSEVRRTAAEALAKIGDGAGRQALAAALEDRDFEVRKTSAWALGKLRDARAVKPLTAALKDENAEVRKAAVRALGTIGDAGAVEPLVEALRDEYVTVRRLAAEVLEALGMTETYDTLTRRALEEFQAADHIGDATTEARLETLRRDHELMRRAWKLSQKTEPRDVRSILQHVVLTSNQFDGDWVRSGETEKLATLLVTAYDAEPLLACLASQEAEKASGVLCEICNGVPVGDATRDYRDALDVLRPLVYAAFRRVSDARTKQLLIPVLKLKRKCMAAAWVLTRRGVPDDIETRVWYTLVVREFKSTYNVPDANLGPEAVEVLAAALKDGDAYVRRAAAQGLRDIGDAGVGVLAAALRGQDLDLRRAVAEVLKERGVPADLETCVWYALVVHNQRRVETFGPEAVEPLIAALGDREAEVRRIAARALGQIGDARATGPLAALLEDSDTYARKAAAQALTRLQAPGSADRRARSLSG